MIVTILVGIFLAGAFNLLVDPYRVFGSPTFTGINQVKSRAREREHMAKVHTLRRQVFSGLILGNSRAELGLDPSNPQWPQSARPVFNAAMPGTGLAYIESALHFAFGRGGVRHVVIGLDFLDFRVDPDSTDIEQWPTPLFTRTSLWYDRFQAVLTFQSLSDSLLTVLSQRNAFAPRLTATGFNPMNDYVPIAKRDGYHAMFRQRDTENAKNYLRGHKTIFKRDSRSSVDLSRVARITKECESSVVACDFVIYPYHVRILLLYQHTGLWEAFWQWKAALSEIIRGGDVEARHARLFDFSNPSEYSTERVPSKIERTEVRWYWEAGHFKKELGDLVLHRLFSDGSSRAAETFGMELRGTDLSMLKTLAEERLIRYTQVRAAEAKELKDTVDWWRRKGL